jgi:hypothetical protein
MVSEAPENLTHRRTIVELAGNGNLPAVYPYLEFKDSGGLMAYGHDIVEIYKGTKSHCAGWLISCPESKGERTAIEGLRNSVRRRPLTLGVSMSNPSGQFSASLCRPSTAARVWRGRSSGEPLHTPRSMARH